MNHLDALNDAYSTPLPDDYQKRLTGRYYTHKSIAIRMFESLLKEADFVNASMLKVFDPFAGDGRLVVWLIEFCNLHNLTKKWEVYLFDINKIGLYEAEKNIQKLKDRGVEINYTIKHGDTFKIAEAYRDEADIVVTNPPWGLLKPDARELKQLHDDDKQTYINSIKDYDLFLAEKYPISQPKRKFAGWGTNLSRVGVELSHYLLNKHGYCCIVLPASFFADYQSGLIRGEIISSSKLLELAYYPAEAKLFEKADVESSSLVYKKGKISYKTVQLTIFDNFLQVKSSGELLLEKDDNDDYMIPITLGLDSIKVLRKLKESTPTWNEIEKEKLELWSGREIDETGSSKWLSKEAVGIQFIKGRMINRFDRDEEEIVYADKPNYKPSESTSYMRIAWRDVSRPSQKRRVIATIIPKDTVAGNSLGVVYYRNRDETSLFCLLGIMNSLCFEFQLRVYLATGHISLSALRKVHIPAQEITSQLIQLAGLCREKINNKVVSEAKIEAMVAYQVYGLIREDFTLILGAFDKVTQEEKNQILSEFNKLQVS